MPLVAVKQNVDGSIPVAVTENQPLVVDRTTNRLLVDIGSSVALDTLNVNTDQIEGKQDVTNALLTTTAADVATTKGYANVTKGGGVVDSNTQRVTLASDGPGVSSLGTIATNTTKAGSLTMSNSSVSTSSATLLAAASATKALAVQNTSANILYVSTTSPATATNGIVLAAGQGYEFPFIPSNALYCLGSAASTTYTIWYA